jgi:hypothetical protein
MEIIPHSHLGMSGTVQKHMLVYTAVLAGLLAAFFDLGRIASLGAVFYLVMDMIVHWGVLRHLRKDVEANAAILIVAIVLDMIVLTAFLVMKSQSDPMIIWVACVGIVAIFGAERFFLQARRKDDHSHRAN